MGKWMIPVTVADYLVIGVAVAPFAAYAILTGFVVSETPTLPWTAIHLVPL